MAGEGRTRFPPPISLRTFCWWPPVPRRTWPGTPNPTPGSRLKEEFGAKNVMVRGAAKVGLHLMIGLVALFADQLLKLIS